MKMGVAHTKTQKYIFFVFLSTFFSWNPENCARCCLYHTLSISVKIPIHLSFFAHKGKKNVGDFFPLKIPISENLPMSTK